MAAPLVWFLGKKEVRIRKEFSVGRGTLESCSMSACPSHEEDPFLFFSVVLSCPDRLPLLIILQFPWTSQSQNFLSPHMPEKAGRLGTDTVPGSLGLETWSVFFRNSSDEKPLLAVPLCARAHTLT